MQLILYWIKTSSNGCRKNYRYCTGTRYRTAIRTAKMFASSLNYTAFVLYYLIHVYIPSHQLLSHTFWVRVFGGRNVWLPVSKSEGRKKKNLWMSGFERHHKTIPLLCFVAKWKFEPVFSSWVSPAMRRRLRPALSKSGLPLCTCPVCSARLLGNPVLIRL